MTRIVYLTSNHTSADPLRSDWTARWGGITETGRSIGEAVDRIARHAPDGRLDRLVFVAREDTPLDLAATRDRRPTPRRPEDPRV